MKITLIAGARPNLVKIALIIKASDNFFEELGIRTPEVNLECGSGSQAN